MAKAVGWTFMGIEYETGKEARSDQETYLRGVFRESYKKKLDVLQGSNYYVNYFKNSSCLFLIPLRDVMETLELLEQVCFIMKYIK